MRLFACLRAYLKVQWPASLINKMNLMHFKWTTHCNYFGWRKTFVSVKVFSPYLSSFFDLLLRSHRIFFLHEVRKVDESQKDTAIGAQTSGPFPTSTDWNQPKCQKAHYDSIWNLSRRIRHCSYRECQKFHFHSLGSWNPCHQWHANDA